MKHVGKTSGTAFDLDGRTRDDGDSVLCERVRSCLLAADWWGIFEGATTRPRRPDRCALGHHVSYYNTNEKPMQACQPVGGKGLRTGTVLYSYPSTSTK